METEKQVETTNSTISQRFLPHQQTIQENMDQLVAKINLESIKHGLVMMKIIPKEMFIHIHDLDIRKVLEHVANKGLVVFVKFINCLLATAQHAVVEILEPDLVFISNSGDQIDGRVVMGKTIFRQPEYDAYPMLSNPRGYALIISNTEFDDPDLYSTRVGGDKDEDGILKLFDSLMFETIMHRNKTRDEMENILREFREMDHTNSNAVVIVIMSHGEEKGIVGTDGFCLSEKSITDNFSSDNCLALAHKPKLFIFQACRGGKKDFGNLAPLSNIIRGNGRSIQTDGKRALKEEASALAPMYSHMKVCRSSYDGYASMRNPEYGTWFIQSIVNIFGKYAHEMHLEDLLKKVSKQVREIGMNEGCLQTVDIAAVGWERHLYFNPGFHMK